MKIRTRSFLDYLVLTIIVLIVFVICFTPTWIFIVVKNIVDPVGFWQNFALYGLGLWMLGGLQLFLFFIFVVFLRYVFGKNL